MSFSLFSRRGLLESIETAYLDRPKSDVLKELRDDIAKIEDWFDRGCPCSMTTVVMISYTEKDKDEELADHEPPVEEGKLVDYRGQPHILLPRGYSNLTMHQRWVVKEIIEPSGARRWLLPETDWKNSDVSPKPVSTTPQPTQAVIRPKLVRKPRKQSRAEAEWEAFEQGRSLEPEDGSEPWSKEKASSWQYWTYLVKLARNGVPEENKLGGFLIDLAAPLYWRDYFDLQELEREERVVEDMLFWVNNKNNGRVSRLASKAGIKDVEREIRRAVRAVQECGPGIRYYYAQIQLRKDFTPSERVSIAKALEREIGNRRGQRTDLPHVQELAHVEPGKKTRDLAAEKAGFYNHESYRQAAKVVVNGTATLIEAMDQGRVSISAAAILAGVPGDDQDEILELDEKAILAAAKEIRERQAQERAGRQKDMVPKPSSRSKADKIRATKLLHGDCLKVLPTISSASVDAIIMDPIYPEVDREYGRISEADWHELMRGVVKEGRRILKPTGSMVVILQPNYEKVGKMRLWLWDFVTWAGREWNLVQDVYAWAFDAMPLSGTNRKQGLMRASVKMCIWLGPADCYRNQEAVLCEPSEYNFAERRATSALHRSRAGRTFRGQRIADTVDERGGTTPFNLLPMPNGGAAAENHKHPASTPYDLALWWCRYILPPQGVLLDPMVGSGTMLESGLECGASKVIGIDRQKKYLASAKKRLGL